MHEGKEAVAKRDKGLDLEEVITKYRSVISFRVKKSLGTYNPDWEDVVNEIITNVIENVKKGGFRGESSIGTFIYTITSRRIVDYIRQKTKVMKYVQEPSPFPDPQEQVEKKERDELIAKSIKKLKPKYKDILYLYYFKGLSREEVARKLDISPRRVSERVNYSLKLLKKIIKQ